MAQSLKVPGILQTRAAVEPSTFNPETGSVEVVFSTGARGLRRSLFGSYYEELEISDKAVDLSRLNNGASVLNAHSSMDVRDVIGVVERAWIAGNEGRALVRFSDREDVKPIRADIQNGILRHISVGYSVGKYEEIAKVEDVPVYRATQWTPAELSVVPIAFDDGAMVRGRPEQEFRDVELVSITKEKRMSETTAAPAAPAPAPAETRTSTIEGATRAAAETRMREVKERAESEHRAAESARQAERERVSTIRSLVRRAGLGEELSDKFVADDVSVDDVRTVILDHLADGGESTKTIAHLSIQAGEDRRDKFVKGASAWLFERTGKADLIEKAQSTDPRRFKDVALDPGEFRGLSLVELARESLERQGVRTRGMDRMTLVAQAFTFRAGYQTTSDFSTMLENVLFKVLLGQYAITDDTWSMFCKSETVADFRASNRYRLGSLSVLDSVSEHGEFKNKVIPDASKISIQAATKGNIIALSRQAIVNDDMGALTNVASMLGRAAKLSIESDVYALLALNSGLGPTQADSQPFFHSNRANVNATASAITVAGVNADATVMASQKDPSSNEYLDLRPSVLLVPFGLRGDANTINGAQYDPADSKFQKPNYVRGMFQTVVGTPRLTGTRRYLFADPSVVPAIVVAFLEGQGQAPVLESEQGWRVDGVEWKVRLDYKAQMFDPKGAITNAGL